MQNALYKIFLCDFLNPISDKKCEFIRKAAIVLKRNNALEYKIVEVGKESNVLKKYSSKKSIEIVEMINQLAMPSFFDMHFHWVQDDVRTMPKDNLLDWLSKYTWPFESKFKDKKYAEKKAKKFSQELLANGTLGGGCYASIHGHTVDLGLKHFVGDFTIGNVLMTMQSPDYLIQSKKNAINIVEKKAKRFRESYAVTPRFAITTHPSVMKTTSQIGKKQNCFIQTHLSETPQEIGFVLDIYRKIKGFEKIESYTDVYKKCGLLGSKTIMGHCIHLSDKELHTLSKTKTSIAHCPTSNAPVSEMGLGSGLFNFTKAEKAGVRWALASDIGGGPFLSMFDVMRSFVQQNRKKKIKGGTFIKALYRSTLAGAEIMKLSKHSGNLSLGKYANMIFVDSPRKVKGESSESILEKIIIKNKSDRNCYNNLVLKCFYRGKELYSKNN